jgi:LDH2 family malate/lactate/ureidoglycolate dehydrogenase
MEQLRQDIIHAPRLPGVERLLLPGELEHERRQERWRQGIPVHANAPAALQEFCTTLGLPLPALL